MLVVFSPIFVAGTKIISRHDFVAPLSTKLLKCGLHQNFINKNKFVKRNVVVELLKLLQLAWVIMLINPIKKDSMNISVHLQI